MKITFSVPLLLCVLQEAREGLREAMAKDVVALNAELSASHDEKSSEKHCHIPAIPDLDHHLLLSTPSLSGYGCKWLWLCPVIGPSSHCRLPSLNNLMD